MKTPCSFLLLFAIATMTQFRDIDADCNAVPIEKWNGSPSNRKTDLAKPVKLVVVQHTVTKDCSTDAECEAILRSIRKYQMNDLKYDDIGQSFIVGGNGKVYEGAGWKVGAHSLGFNDRSISVSFIGDFREKTPTPEALQAAQEFLACSLSSKNLDERYSLVGHMQLSLTLSPGASLQNVIKTWPHWTSDVTNIFQ